MINWKKTVMGKQYNGFFKWICYFREYPEMEKDKCIVFEVIYDDIKMNLGLDVSCQQYHHQLFFSNADLVILLQSLIKLYIHNSVVYYN